MVNLEHSHLFREVSLDLTASLVLVHLNFKSLKLSVTLHEK